LDVISVLAPVKACQAAAAVDFPTFLVRVAVARRVEKIDGSRLRRYPDGVAVAIERDSRQWNGAHANGPKMGALALYIYILYIYIYIIYIYIYIN
jgi:hypothetical protein